MRIFHLTKMLSGGGGVYTARLSEALRRSRVESRVLSLDDGSLVSHNRLVGKINTRFDWALNGTINRRSRGTVLTYFRRQIWNPESEIQSHDFLHLHSITGFIGDRGLRSLLRNRPRVFWTAHNPWLFTGGCVVYAGCDRFESGCRRCPLLKFPIEGWAKRELKAKVKFWRDYDVQPIANSNWMAAMMRRSPLFEGMDIPVIPPIVDDIFFATAKDTNLLGRVGKRGVWSGEQEAEAKAESRIALDSYSPANSHPPLAKASKALGGNRFVVGMSARSLTDGGKGIEEFFQRLPLDRAFLKDTTFILIGEGNIRIPAGLDFRLTGLIFEPKRLAEMYCSLDLFVSASVMETFGMAILEAQACGTPVVAFETGGTPEAVCLAGSKLVRNGDWAALFHELEGMFENATKSGGKKHELSKWVSQRYSWQAIAEKQIKVYDTL